MWVYTYDGQFFFVLASARCRFFRAKLWDIETVNEFDYVIGRIYNQMQSFDSPRIAVNFTQGKHGKFNFLSVWYVTIVLACSIKTLQENG